MPPIASPCTGVCKLGRGGVCRGCGRVLDEIAAWPVASDARRQAMVKAARQRLAALRKSRNSAP